MKKMLLWSIVVPMIVIMSSATPSPADENCHKGYPYPILEQVCGQFDCLNADGRVILTVRNASAYDGMIKTIGGGYCNGRADVNIYNADTNQFIYGYCALSSYVDLQNLWFSSNGAFGGSIYLMITDKACGKTYKSNVVKWLKNRIAI